MEGLLNGLPERIRVMIKLLLNSKDLVLHGKRGQVIFDFKDNNVEMKVTNIVEKE